MEKTTSNHVISPIDYARVELYDFETSSGKFTLQFVDLAQMMGDCQVVTLVSPGTTAASSFVIRSPRLLCKRFLSKNLQVDGDVLDACFDVVSHHFKKYENDLR